VLEEWNGALPQIGVPMAGPSSDTESGRSSGVAGKDELEGEGGLTDEQRYLMRLLLRQPHEEAACAGGSCFCQKHASLFGKGRPPSEGSPEAMEEGDEPSTAGASSELPPLKRARSSKAFWEEEKRATSMVHTVQSEKPTPHNDARGKDAIHGWVATCTNCTLTSMARGGLLAWGGGGASREPRDALRY
jgi:hypothetical protein